jgi:hypothetical protein
MPYVTTGSLNAPRMQFVSNAAHAGDARVPNVLHDGSQICHALRGVGLDL